MNLFGLLLVFLGIVYLIYSFLCKDKLNYYTKRYNRKYKITFLKSNEFLKLQLNFAIFNSIYCIFFGLFITLFNFISFFVCLGILGFHIINFILIVEGKAMGYISYQ